MGTQQPDQELVEALATVKDLRAEADAREAEIIRTALARTGGNVMQAAEVLGVDRAWLDGALRFRHKALGAEFPRRPGRPSTVASVDSGRK